MGDGDRNRMGKKQLEVASPLVATEGKKGVGIMKSIVNLFIRGDFYWTFGIKLRASALLGRGTDPPELGLAGQTRAESVTVPGNTPGNGPCARMTCETPSAIPDPGLGSFPSSSGALGCGCSAPWQNWVPPNLRWAERFLRPRQNNCSPPAQPRTFCRSSSVALRCLLHGEARRQVGPGTMGRCKDAAGKLLC